MTDLLDQLVVKIHRARSWLSDPLVFTQAAVIGFTVFVFLLCLYNYFLHPIAHIKGPFLAAVSPVSLSSYSALRDIHNPGPDGHHYTKRGTSEDLVLRFVFGAKNMLLVDEGEAHKRLRVALQPAFTAKAMRDQQDITNHHVEKTVERLLEAAMNPSQAISLTKELNKLVWGNVGNLAFGEPATLEQLEHHEKAKDFHAKIAPIFEFFQYLNGNPILGRMARLSVGVSRRVFGLSGNILGKDQLRRRMACQEGQKNFLTAVLGAKESAGLSFDEIHSNMLLLLMGGYDSSATTLSAIFYHLLQDPQQYKRLQSELHRAYSSVSDITCSGLLSQRMLSACINETLRLVPPLNGHGSHRITTSGTMIDGVWVPAGTLISADFYSLHRDPSCWAFPDEYRPERWLEEHHGPGTPFEKDVRTAWRPFSLGPRVCIGREMALQSIRLAVAKILYTCDMTLVNRDFVWDRDAGSHYMWHGFDIVVKVAKA
ncbi:cytochrome P450 [Fusarium redolens]|uniref:Cytochrome P450 n=1 Tax=Fusarium redolens TaxID=48865 RepID=A0A9P9HKW1_FUSRE|nr:cytochrome P450 [Fusarium redolens]KAH7258848.1 cytochrome P450 [Fusarium redolens]